MHLLFVRQFFLSLLILHAPIVHAQFTCRCCMFSPGRACVCVCVCVCVWSCCSAFFKLQSISAVLLLSVREGGGGALGMWARGALWGTTLRGKTSTRTR